MKKLPKQYITECEKLVELPDSKSNFGDLSHVIEKLRQVSKNVEQQKPKPLSKIVEFQPKQTIKTVAPVETKIMALEPEVVQSHEQRLKLMLPKIKSGFEAIRENIRKQIVAKCLALPGICTTGIAIGENKNQILATYRKEFFQEIEQYIKDQHHQFFGKDYESTKFIGQGENARLTYNLESLQQVGMMFTDELATPVKIPECSTSGMVSLLTPAKLKYLGLAISQWFVTYYMYYRYVYDLDAINGSSEDEQLAVYKDCLDLIKKPHEPPFKMGTVTKLTKLLDSYKFAAKTACGSNREVTQTPKKRMRESPKKSTMSKSTPKKEQKEIESIIEDEDLELSSSSDSDDENGKEPPAKRRKKS